MKNSIILLIMGLFLGSCQQDFFGQISSYEVNSPRCQSSNPCESGLELCRTDENHVVTCQCYFVRAADCWFNACDTLDCDDGSFCTEDYCDSVSQDCVFEYSCDDFDECTDDFCLGWYCNYPPIDCDDGDYCTDDFCVNGDCINQEKNCTDNNPCTSDNCNPKTGTCVSVDSCNAGCSFDTIIDPNYNEWCKVVVCVNGNEYNAQRSCDDGDACTNDICYNEMCHNPEVNCDDGTDCVNNGTCWCDDGYCVYGSGKRIPAALVESLNNASKEIHGLYSADGKLLEVIFPDRVMEFAMMFAHSDYPSGMYLLKSGNQTTKLIKP